MSEMLKSSVTILDCAVARGAKADEESGNFTMGDIEAVGLPFFGGCQLCHASIACYNAYPSKTNYLRCRACIGDLGFATTGEFEEWCKQFDQGLPHDDEHEDDDSYVGLGDEFEIEDIECATEGGQ